MNMKNIFIISVILILFSYSLVLSQIKQENNSKVCIGLLYKPANDSIVILHVQKNDFEMSFFNISSYGKAFRNKYFAGYKDLVPSRSALNFTIKGNTYSIPVQDNVAYEEIFIDCKNNVFTKIITDEMSFWKKSQNKETLIIECFVSKQKYPSNWVKTFSDSYITYIRRITRVVFKS